MAKNKSKRSALKKQENQKFIFWYIIEYIIIFILDVFILASHRTQSFFRWLTMTLVRGYILLHDWHLKSGSFVNEIGYFLKPDENTNWFVSGIMWTIMFAVMCLIFLWIISTIILVAIPIVSRGFNENEGEFAEIHRLKEWRDNKISFSSYEDGMQLMRNTAVINNLDEKNPEARNMLSYINNKLRFRSYPSGLDFLRGKK